MPRISRCWIALMMLVCPIGLCRGRESPSLPRVVANDNRTPAGQFKKGLLELKLVLREATWFPEGEEGSHRDVYVFGEEGRAPQSSGPLIRVPRGAQIHLDVRNSLPIAAKIYGLHRHPGDSKDSVNLAPGETRQLEFLAGEVGTYMYWATTADKSLEDRIDAETLLFGAFIVDEPGAKTDDRIFVLGDWGKPPTATSGPDQFLFINGKSWPYTERLTFKLGETAHWRVINPTASDHAMHLHGFYFSVDGVGDGERFERYAPELQRMAVTEHIDIGHVFEMTWTPERAGNWLFHCHMMAHMMPTDELHPGDAKSADHMAAHEHSAGMGGLVMGITVLPGAATAANPAVTAATHKLQLVISQQPEKIPLYNLEVNDPKAPGKPDKEKPSSLLGPPIILTRGEMVEIEVKNRSSSPTAIHWHGIQLESYYDGVPGWTGSGQQTTPPIAPGESFVARMAPPQAGTFIYHTHWHDRAQLLNGVYGPLIILEPGQKFDSNLDRSFVFSMGSYDPFGLMLLINGNPQPGMMEMHTGTRYRLRFINICDDEGDLRVRLTSINSEAPLKWKVIAKDGMNLPAAQLKMALAEMGITVGETYDVEFQAESSGLARLEIWQPSYPSSVIQPLKFVSAP
jgi:FtsP/CotA-like multicopper oxidase with cupredoxin domain